MSKVSEFISDARTTGLREAAYLLHPVVKQSSQVRWPIGNQDVRPGTSNFHHLAASNAGKSFPEQIRAALTSHYRYIGQTSSRKSVDRQVKQLNVHYQDLKKLGFDIQDVSTFRLRHAKALLSKWQTGKCAANTVYSRWSGLRTWARVLGKHGMLCSLKDLQPGFDRRPQPGNSYRVLTCDQVAVRSQYLETKPDLTAYFVDRLSRELGMTREQALQVDISAVKSVIQGETTILRVGIGNERKNIPQAQLEIELLSRICEFMASRNRKTLAWSNLDLNASLQKYTLRLSYVTRTLFQQTARSEQPVNQEGGAA